MFESVPEFRVASPLAFVAVETQGRRRDIAAALRADGWAVAELPTGFHLVRALADWILEKGSDIKPSLIIVDAILPGCTGMSVASGLADIGWQTPVVILTNENPGSLVCAKSAEQQIFLRAWGPMSALTQLARRFRQPFSRANTQRGWQTALR
jgi:hypothetical protein